MYQPQRLKFAPKYFYYNIIISPIVDDSISLTQKMKLKTKRAYLTHISQLLRAAMFLLLTNYLCKKMSLDYLLLHSWLDAEPLVNLVHLPLRVLSTLFGQFRQLRSVTRPRPEYKRRFIFICGRIKKQFGTKWREG